jgi:hypothetical protein
MHIHIRSLSSSQSIYILFRLKMTATNSNPSFTGESSRSGAQAPVAPTPTQEHLILQDVPPVYDLLITPPAYPEAVITVRSHTHPVLDTSYQQSHISREDLPVYAANTETEPQTLARGLWVWGWAIPLLWIVGMCMCVVLVVCADDQIVDTAQTA